METVFYCGDCGKFFYAPAGEGQASATCTHCNSELTISCQLTKEQYAALSEDRKNQWKGAIRQQYPTKESVTNQLRHMQYLVRRDKILGILFVISGSRGRIMYVGRNKCIIETKVTAGSVLTGNATDGEKVIFYRDCSALQFKQAGLTLGYLQFETPSMQMNNQTSNFFSENTFTFEVGSSGLSNELMREVFYYVLELIELQKNNPGMEAIPEFPPLLADYVAKIRQ